ncbi:NUMOD4 motif-containing HNH endonuclease [Erwinia sp. JH02]|uniref:NUMOD4 motif-containing HNH endonuclease n=1 Tax=Erwinia sp. JH02 TaxID=2733394 RepID=UPI001487F73E|nr:NUMOD4 motif-containing HNH endonuclease [Erwinia sp. JH02]NNS07293.1 hypothetical protein [Erwinia sp. JH02]
MSEIWVAICGYEGVAEVSNLGNVRTIDRVLRGGKNIYGREMTKVPDKDGYLRVGINKNNKQVRFIVHRLVALAFLPEETDKSFVNHKNGIKHDNRLENLEWCTAKENSLHAVKTGLKPRSPNTYPGVSHNTCKGIVIATNIKSGQKITMAGVAEYAKNGFRADCVYKCLAGENKSHKGHTFNRLSKEPTL